MLGFIVAVVAGFLARYVEVPVVQPLVRALEGRIAIEPGEVRLLCFMVVMLLAGIAAELLHSGSTFWLILGGIIGYFATRLVDAARTAIDSRNAR